MGCCAMNADAYQQVLIPEEINDKGTNTSLSDQKKRQFKNQNNMNSDEEKKNSKQKQKPNLLAPKINVNNENQQLTNSVIQKRKIQNFASLKSQAKTQAIHDFDIDFANLEQLIDKQLPPLVKGVDYFRKYSCYYDEQQKEQNLSKSSSIFKNASSSQIETQQFQYWNTIFNSEDACLRACIDIIKFMKKSGIKQFTDNDFGPNKKSDPHGIKSLFFDGIQPGFPTQDEFEWLRPQQIIERMAQNQIKGIKPDAKCMFIDEGATSNDVQQGILGNCWFISALSVLAGNDQWIRGEINSKKQWNELSKEERRQMSEGLYPPIFHFLEKYGIYVIRFYKNRQWRYVLIDNKLPVRKNGTYIYSHCKNFCELWVSIIEKAYAKLHNCYEALVAGDTSQGLADMTSLVPIKKKLNHFRFNFSQKDDQFLDSKNEVVNEMEIFNKLINIKEIGIQNSINLVNQSKDELWEYMIQQKNLGSLMGCSAEGEDGEIIDGKGQATGLYANHAYGIIDCFTLKYTHDELTSKTNSHGNHRILRIRNPWGYGEWKLKWSENQYEQKLKHFMDQIDKYYNKLESVAQEKGQEIPERYVIDNNDGTFLMCYSDWRRIFSNLYVSQKFDLNWSGRQVHDLWTKKTSSGKILKTEKSKIDFALKNPQYIMNINPAYKPQKVNVLVSLEQNDGRLYRDSVFPFEFINQKVFLAVIKLNNEEEKLQKFEMEQLVGSSGKYILRRDINTGVIQLGMGSYAIIPSTAEKQITGSFSLNFYFDCEPSEILIYKSDQKENTQLSVIQIEEETHDNEQENKLSLAVKEFIHKHVDTLLRNFSQQQQQITDKNMKMPLKSVK